MATQITSIRLPKELSERYSRLAKATGCTHYYYIAEALEGAIDEFEHEAELIKLVEDYRAGRLKTYTLKEVRTHCGLDD
ncbi:type II toxin-antitoxin system RelB family antitoxin [Lancefieldella rimae]